MTQEKKQEFGKWRSFFWPVHSFELKKLLPMFLMFFFISFNYTILRDTKDALVVTSSGAGTLPFLKVWGVVPAAVLFMLVYAKLSNILTKEKLFYVTLAPFVAFFALFPTVIYPNRELLHPTVAANYLEAFLPLGLVGLVDCFRDWTFSLFYILAELWGSVVLSLLFWGFANDIMRVTEAKRFYTLLGLGANLALLVSGPLIMYFSGVQKNLAVGVDPWQTTLYYLMGMVVISGFLIAGIYRWINRNVLTDALLYDPKDVKKKKEKPKLSIGESLKFLAKSKYILCIAILVIAYGMSINMVEVIWKGQVKEAYPLANEYVNFMGMYSTIMGTVTICMMFVGGFVIRRFGWGMGAIFTPVILLITGGAFFSFLIFGNSMTGLLGFLNATPVIAAVFIGMSQNIATKSSKYSLFDPTKEMAYIPLDAESKVKGKAAIDVVGARLGKSGGSLIQQFLFVFVGWTATTAITTKEELLDAITPYVAVLTIAVIIAWMYAVRSLNRQFLTKTEGEPAEAATPEPAKAATAEPATA